ncbi:hypothetical protein AWC38_SpisGene704 [Stylophora pistillata]|uniref:Uncharacterized protein n=1 Tax=Stylophora pistillata TaxID=50429 RepID=A0A2B4T167_STYPI|nr:hypothetical protein AWC38_SpisGene704 [Stylophora pistillata]
MDANLKDTETLEKTKNVLRVEIIGFATVQTGSNSELLQVQKCKWCAKNHCCDTTTECDKENYYGMQADSAIDGHRGRSSPAIDSPMPIISKRGYLNSTEYVLLRVQLKGLQDRGEFERHEKLIQLQLLKMLAGDVDKEASLKIERAMALYFQNKVKDAKNILKMILKEEQRLENPGILTGRALTLLTAIYKHQGKYGNAMKCVLKANRALEYHDCCDDKAELCHSYGALLNSLPTTNLTQDTQATKEEVYKSYDMACHYTSNEGFKEYVHVKMAAMLLKSCSKAVDSGTSLCKEDVVTAKLHLDFIEFGGAADNMTLGTKIKHLLFRSDQHLYEENVAMALEKAHEARELIHRHRFELELISAEKRMNHLSELLKQQDQEWRSKEPHSGDDYLSDTERNGGLSELVVVVLNLL